MNSWTFRAKRNSKVVTLAWVHGQEGLGKSFICAPSVFKTRTQRSFWDTPYQSSEPALAAPAGRVRPGRASTWNRKLPPAGRRPGLGGPHGRTTARTQDGVQTLGTGVRAQARPGWQRLLQVASSRDKHVAVPPSFRRHEVLEGGNVDFCARPEWGAHVGPDRGAFWPPASLRPHAPP